MYKINKFFKKIKKLFDYIPIIWNDEDWDYFYFLNLMEFKMNRMEDYFRNHGMSTDNIEVADQIKLSKDIINKIKDDKYFDEVFSDYYNKWDYPRIEKVDDVTVMKEMPPEMREEFNKRSDAYNTITENNLKECFENIAKNVRVWGD